MQTKVSVSAALLIAILTAAIAAVGYRLYRSNVTERYIAYTDTVLNYAYRAAEEYSFGDMIAAREMPEGYEKLRSELNQIKECSEIEYLYAIYFDDADDMHSLHYAINAKTQAELADGRPLSEIYSYMGKSCEANAFEDETLKILWNAVRNKSRENGTLEGHSDEYGFMLNGYRVIYDSNDNAAGLICVEIDINRINNGLRSYVRTVILIGVMLAVAVILIYLLTARHYLLGPIARIAESSDSFVKKMQLQAAPEELVFADPKVKSKGEMRLLADNVKSLADGVTSYITNLRTVTAEQERIGTELKLARAIQAAMLPHDFPPYPDRHEFSVFADMEPAREVGGDFYDFFLIDRDHLCLVTADVSGKGIPAALYMMISKTILQSCAMLGKSAGEILAKTNRALCSNNQAEMFVTVWLGILELSTGKLVAANAGHEYPVIKRCGGMFELMKDKHGLAIGCMDGIRYREYELMLHPGDKLFLYTDGVPEATGADDKMFGIGRMLGALNQNADASPEELLHNVRCAVSEFVGDAEQFDDLTMLCVEYHGYGTEHDEKTV